MKGTDPLACGVMPDPETREMQIVQRKREEEERERASGTEDPTEEHTHVRRADRAAYLREKLDERAKSEDE
jgi:hypothetical protein